DNNYSGPSGLRGHCEQDILGSISVGVVDRDDAKTISADWRAAAVHLLREAAEHRREFGFLIVNRHHEIDQSGSFSAPLRASRVVRGHGDCSTPAGSRVSPSTHA